jgi:predicted Rossmann-fold nucleotide-binding protein
MLRKLPIVAVLGSGAPIAPERAALARGIGALVARLDAHLLTGAGFGVMAAAAEGFTGVAERAGFSIGIVPRDPSGAIDAPNRAADGTPYPNPFVEIAVFTALPPRVADWRQLPSRNHVNIFTAHALVALPGAAGTANELAMAAAFTRNGVGSHGSRPTLLLGPREEFPAEGLAAFTHVPSLDEAEQALVQLLRSSAPASTGAHA